MAKSKKTVDDGEWTGEEPEPETIGSAGFPLAGTSDTAEEQVPPTQPAENKYFELVPWNNVKQVYKCSTCGTNRDDHDAIILHVLIHVPVNEREAVFEELMKEN